MFLQAFRLFFFNLLPGSSWTRLQSMGGCVSYDMPELHEGSEEWLRERFSAKNTLIVKTYRIRVQSLTSSHRYLPHGQKNIGHRKHQRKVDAVKKPQDIELYQRRNVLLYLPVGTRAFVSLFFCLLCAILFLQGHHWIVAIWKESYQSPDRGASKWRYSDSFFYRKYLQASLLQLNDNYSRLFWFNRVSI